MKTWRYSVPSENCEGWAILFLDDAGCFAVLSDYGNYAYRWNARGFGSPGGIRPFLLGCDNGYLAGKLSPQKVYDGDATLRAVREYILERRRERDWTAERARDEWDLLEWNDLDSEFRFQTWLNDTKIEDPWEGLAQYALDIHAAAFLERAWPRLKSLIQADLASEQVAA